MVHLLERLKSDGVIESYQEINGGVTEYLVEVDDGSNLQELSEKLVGAWKVRTDGGEVYLYDGNQSSTGIVQN